jgi:hypothetical protein
MVRVEELVGVSGMTVTLQMFALNMQPGKHEAGKSEA